MDHQPTQEPYLSLVALQLELQDGTSLCADEEGVQVVGPGATSLGTAISPRNALRSFSRIVDQINGGARGTGRRP